MARAVLCSILLFLGATPSLAAEKDDALHWYRCNTHTHTNAGRSTDVNAPPEAVARWFRDHGYQCLVITDHEALTDVAPLNRVLGSDGQFLVIQGEEITQQVIDPGHPGGVRHGHVNAIGANTAIMPVGYPEKASGVTLGETYKRNVGAIRQAGGLAQINHPNLAWSATVGDLLGLEGPYLMEVANSYFTANNLGGAEGSGSPTPSTEVLWDSLLSAGRAVWATASDDSHDYIHFDDRDAPTPGKGWIVVRAPQLSRDAIVDGLTRGQFYASTGIWLERYDVDDTGISLGLARSPAGAGKPDTPTRFVTRFIGADGKLLAEVVGRTPSYRFKGGERYVRASITDSDGKRAWTQPVYPSAR